MVARQIGSRAVWLSADKIFAILQAVFTRTEQGHCHECANEPPRPWKNGNEHPHVCTFRSRHGCGRGIVLVSQQTRSQLLGGAENTRWFTGDAGELRKQKPYRACPRFGRAYNRRTMGRPSRGHLFVAVPTLFRMWNKSRLERKKRQRGSPTERAIANHPTHFVKSMWKATCEGTASRREGGE